jgi:hypothetical protein
MIYLNQALDRIHAIKWGDDKLSTDLYCELFNEYFRRAAQWRKLLNCTESAWPLFDIPFYIDSTIRVDEAIIINDLWNYPWQTKMPDPFVIKIYELYLHWVVLDNTISLKKFNLAPPYEPLIVMYEQGIALAPENGGFAIPGGIVWARDSIYYLDKPPFESSLLNEN